MVIQLSGFVIAALTCTSVILLIILNFIARQRI